MMNEERKHTKDPWAGEVRPMPGGFAGEERPWRGDTGSRTGMPSQRPALPRAEEAPVPEEWVDLRHGLPAEVIDAPLSREEHHMGSLKAMLSKNVGTYIMARFLIGTQNMISCEGTLYDVGNDYLVIHQEGRDRFVVSDFYSLKFVEFCDAQRQREQRSSLQGMEWQSAMH